MKQYSTPLGQALERIESILEQASRQARASLAPHPEWPNDEGERFFTVLQVPPVADAQSAVKAAIVAEASDK